MIPSHCTANLEFISGKVYSRGLLNMGIEVIAWVLSLTAIVFLLVLLGRLFVTVLKIAVVVAVIWFVMSKLYPTKEITPPSVKIKAHTHA